MTLYSFFNASVLLTISGCAIFLMFNTPQKPHRVFRNARGIFQALSCWSLGMSAAAMAFYPEANTVSAIYLWWRSSVMVFIITVVLNKTHPSI